MDNQRLSWDNADRNINLVEVRKALNFVFRCSFEISFQFLDRGMRLSSGVLKVIWQYWLIQHSTEVWHPLVRWLIQSLASFGQVTDTISFSKSESTSQLDLITLDASYLTHFSYEWQTNCPFQVYQHLLTPNQLTSLLIRTSPVWPSVSQKRWLKGGNVF